MDIDGRRLHVFCAVLAWSRVRFVRFAGDEKATTTLGLLAECFEVFGDVPKVVLADRMACLKGGVVANVVVPTPGYVRFATHYRVRPDFCEAADPESNGIVEKLVGYAKDDLVVPLSINYQESGLVVAGGGLARLDEAAAAWCAEVNTAVHSEICAVLPSGWSPSRSCSGRCRRCACVAPLAGASSAVARFRERN